MPYIPTKLWCIPCDLHTSHTENQACLNYKHSQGPNIRINGCNSSIQLHVQSQSSLAKVTPCQTHSLTHLVVHAASDLIPPWLIEWIWQSKHELEGRVQTMVQSSQSSYKGNPNYSFLLKAGLTLKFIDKCIQLWLIKGGNNVN